MSYSRSRPVWPRPQLGLGYDVEIDTPLGKQTVSFDLEKVSKDVTKQLVSDAWPQLETKARQAIPTFVADAMTHARPEVEAQKKQLVQQAGLLVGLLAVSVIGAAWYVGRPAERPKRKRPSTTASAWST